MEYTVLLQPALLVATAGTVLFLFGRAIKQRSVQPLKGAMLSAVLGLTLVSSLVVTGPGHRGVIYSQSGGVQDAERVEGLSFIVPYLQSAIQMDVRTQKFFTECDILGINCVNAVYAQSLDLQEITVHIAVNYYVDPTQAAELYREVGRSYEEVVVKPAVFQHVKAEVGQIKAVDFARQRQVLAAAIHTELTFALNPFGIYIQAVSIEDAIFDPAFITAVKEKVIADEEAAEQERLVAAEAAKKDQVILQAEAAAAYTLIKATAQAQANDLLSASLTADLLIWRRITDWDGVLPTTFIGGKDPLDLLFTVK